MYKRKFYFQFTYNCSIDSSTVYFDVVGVWIIWKNVWEITKPWFSSKLQSLMLKYNIYAYSDGFEVPRYKVQGWSQKNHHRDHHRLVYTAHVDNIPIILLYCHALSIGKSPPSHRGMYRRREEKAWEKLRRKARDAHDVGTRVHSRFRERRRKTD